MTGDGSADAGHYQLRHKSYAWAAAICLAAIVPYLPSLTDYFVRDDFGVVQLLSSKPATWFPRWFVTSWMENIWGFLPDEVRPFPALSYQVTALWGAGSPVGHHLLNVALHAANGLLVLAIAREAAALPLEAAATAALAFVLLPVHAESVAWITGRVDSMPAFFYLASFLAFVRWRAGGPARQYAWSLALFFVALFTKQNTITMVGTLVSYDLLIARRPVRRFWTSLGAYGPFVLLTLGYLWLRYVLFGEVAREGQLGGEAAAAFVRLVDRHLAHVVAGSVDAPRVYVALAAVTAAVLALLTDGRAPAFRRLLYFGPVWWLIGVAPIAVAGYESPRHVYLAAVGWAIVLGLAAAGLGRVSQGSRRTIVVPAAAVLAFYAVGLRGAVAAYGEMSATSQDATRTLERRALAAAPGTLVMVGVPLRSWEWAVPFAAQPPFAGSDLTRRVHIVTPRALHCCRGQWFEDTRRSLRAWSRGPASDQVIAMAWDQSTGRRSAASARDNPAILVVARAMLDIADPDALDLNIQRVVAQLTRW
jgi:hypothetical protein